MYGVVLDLHRDHVNAFRLLSVLEEQVEVAESGEEPDFALMQDIMHYLTHYSERCHRPKEDLVLNKLAERDSSLESISLLLNQDGELLAQSGHQLRVLLRGLLRGNCDRQERIGVLGRDYVKAFRKHIDIEEGELFCLADRVFSDRDWAQIGARLPKEKDPVFGDVVQHRYQSLREHLAERNVMGRPGSRSASC